MLEDSSQLEQAAGPGLLGVLQTEKAHSSDLRFLLFFSTVPMCRY